MTPRFVAVALAEFIAAGRYYNEQIPDLGDDFIDEIEAGIGKTLCAPRTCRLIKDDVRRFLVRRFPYGIYYTVENEMVVIWASKHLHRAPDFWQQRRAV
jgi:plasmid stabilization system protein ParE